MTKRRYIRKGKCNQCGKCCHNEECEYLVGTKCSIFGSPDRPDKCVWHPQAPPIIIKECGYYFYDTWENKFVRGTDL